MSPSPHETLLPHEPQATAYMAPHASAHHRYRCSNLQDRAFLVVHELLQVPRRRHRDVCRGINVRVAHALGIVETADDAERLQDQKHNQRDVEVIWRWLQQRMHRRLRHRR